MVRVRITHVGELGWELHVPSSQAAVVLTVDEPRPAVWPVNAGHYAVNSLRWRKVFAPGARIFRRMTRR